MVLRQDRSYTIIREQGGNRDYVPGYGGYEESDNKRRNDKCKFPPPKKNDSPGFKKIRKLTLYTIYNKIKEK